jgi:retinol dehydrogenase-12
MQYLRRKHLTVVGATVGLVGSYALVRKMFVPSVSSGILNDPHKLEGKNIIITGGNAGIGYESVKAFAKMGAQRIIIASRNEYLSKEAIKKIKNEIKSDTEIEFVELDLASLGSTMDTAKLILDKNTPIHVLINNAGCVLDYTVTEDELEGTFQVNHLSHFLLTNLLYDNLANNNARVINVSSMMHKFFRRAPYFDEVKTNPKAVKNGYPHSKLCNILFAKGLQQQFEKDHSNALER